HIGAARGPRRRDFAPLWPQATCPQRRNDLLLIATSMAVHQYLTVVGVAKRQAWRAVVVGRASCRPGAADLPPTEGLCDGLSVHGVVPFCTSPMHAPWRRRAGGFFQFLRCRYGFDYFAVRHIRHLRGG